MPGTSSEWCQARAASAAAVLCLPVVGEFTGTLNNKGEQLELQNGLGVTVASVKYGDSDPWSVMADGFGASLYLRSVAVRLKRKQ